MTELTNAELTENVFKGLCEVVGRRTSNHFACAIIGTITRALEGRFSFLKNINFDDKADCSKVISVSLKINSVKPLILGRALEAIVQILLMDLKDIAGHYFINELKKNTGELTISTLKDMNVDLDLLQIQQHYLYRQSKRTKDESESGTVTEEKNLLDYSWDNVGKCDYDEHQRICVIYDKEGNILDKINLDEIVEKYLSNLTENDTVSTPMNYYIEKKEKRLNLKK